MEAATPKLQSLNFQRCGRLKSNPGSRAYFHLTRSLSPSNYGHGCQKCVCDLLDSLLNRLLLCPKNACCFWSRMSDRASTPYRVVFWVVRLCGMSTCWRMSGTDLVSDLFLTCLSLNLGRWSVAILPLCWNVGTEFLEKSSPGTVALAPRLLHIQFQGFLAFLAGGGVWGRAPCQPHIRNRHTLCFCIFSVGTESQGSINKSNTHTHTRTLLIRVLRLWHSIPGTGSGFSQKLQSTKNRAFLVF